MFVLAAAEGGTSLPNVQEEEAKLNVLATQYAELDAGISPTKLTKLANASLKIHKDILNALMRLENSLASPVIELDARSYNVYARWIELSKNMGRVSSLNLAEGPMIRAILNQISEMAVNSGNTKRINVLREFINAGAGIDGIPGDSLPDISVLVQYASEPRMSFDKIVGMETQKNTIRSMTRRVLIRGTRSGKAKYDAMLLYGPPGTGKTIFAEALASELDYLFIRLANKDLVQKYIGEGERILTEIFRAAAADTIHKGVLILFDEIDSVTGRSSDASIVQKSLTAIFLQETPQLNSHVYLCATTNFPRKVDSAILRRFLPAILVDLPDPDTIEALLNTSVYYEYIHAAAKKDTVKFLHSRHYSQDNIMTMLRLFEDQIVSWASDPAALYVSGPGYSLQTLMDNERVSSTIVYRSAEKGVLRLSERMLPTVGLPFAVDLDAEFKSAIDACSMAATAQIVPTSEQDLKESRILSV